MSDITSLRTRRHRREWDRAIRRFVKRAARHAGADLTASALLPLFVVVAAPGAFALPVGEQVQSGNVTISRPNTSSMTINQGSQKGIVNWNGFSIQSGERVDISQPSAQAVLLNRVVGSDASRIAGQLNANGKVFLVNPAGVVFAQGASVNVGSLVASTLGITNDEFLAGKYHFNQGAAAGAKVSVEAGANLTASSGGAVALLGAQVDNSGYVSATLGKIAIGAGSDITLDFAGDGLTMLKVNDKVANALVSNAGTLEADGGQIVMSVRAADAATAAVVNQTGTVRARSVEARNGRIVLDGGTTGVTNIGGTLDATAPDAGTGGRIDATGYHVAVNDGAQIRADGAQGGGRVRVGGGAAGKATDLANADALWMSPNAHVSADALVSGNGGNIVMYGTEAARVYGELSARGGPQGGNGGLVETSGEYLNTDGARIRLGAPKGHGGQWLLDPASIEIVNTAPSSISTTTSSTTTPPNLTLATGPAPALVTATPVVFSPGASDNYVLASAITSQLDQGASVTISTSSAGTGAFNGDITMLSGTSITKTAPAASSDATLTLSANGSITVLGNIGGAAGGQGPSGRLNVVLDANKGGTGQSNIILSGASISTNGGSLNIGVREADIGTAAAATSFDGAAVGIAGSTLDTTVPQGPAGLASGPVTIHGQGALNVPATIFGVQNPSLGFQTNTPLAPVSIDSASIATSFSDISIAGQAGAGAPAGVVISGARSLHTTSGNINISGSAPTTQASGVTPPETYGVELVPLALGPGSALLSTTSGNVSIAGTGAVLQSATGTVSGGGVLIQPTARLNESNTVIQTGSGNVSIAGTGMSIGTASGNVSGAGVSFRPQALNAGAGPLVHTGSGNVSISGSATTVQNLTGGTLSGAGVSMAPNAGGSVPVGVSVVSDSGNVSVTGKGPSVTGTSSNGATVSGAGIFIAASAAVQTLSTGSVTGYGVQIVPTLVSTTASSVSTTNTPLLQTQAGRISINGNGPAVQTVATGISTAAGSVAGDGVNIVQASLSTGGGAIVPVIGSASGGIAIQGNGAVVQSSPGLVQGDGVHMVGTSISSGGALSLTGTGATLRGGSGNVIASGVFLQNVTLTAKGAIGIDGTAARSQSPASSNLLGQGLLFGDVNINAGGTLDLTGRGPTTTAAGSSVSGAGIELQGGSLTAGGTIGIAGTGPSGSGAQTFVSGDGVELFGNSTSPMRITSTNGGLTIQGTGARGTNVTGGVSGGGAIIDSVNVNVNGVIDMTGTAAAANGGTASVAGFGLTLADTSLISARGPVTLRGTGASGSGAPGNPVRGDGVSLVRTSINTAGAIDLTGTGASANGGTTAVGGAGIYAQNATIASSGGNVALNGTGAKGKVRFVLPPNAEDTAPDFDGVHLEASDIAANAGSLSIRGVAPDGIAAYGVFVSGMAATPARGLRANGAVTIFGLGSGSDGVSLAGTASNRGAVSSAAGSVDIRGGTNGQLDATGARGRGVSIVDADIRANAPAQTVSVTASTPADGAPALFLDRATFSAGDYGAIIVRAANSGTSGNVFDASGASFSSRSGTLVFAPGRVGADFGIVGENAQPINVLGGSSGLTIGPSMLNAAAANIGAIVIGSSTQTGRITVYQATGFTHDLTLQNTGAGSAGIDLLSGVAMPGRTLALASSGPVTDPGGIQAQTLLLTGGGDFDLTDAGNVVGTLALSGAHNVRFSMPGSFTIGTASATGIDGATGALVPIGGTQPNVTGDLTAISENGAIALGSAGAPAQLSAGGSIDLVMQNAVFDNAPGGTLSAGNAWRVWAATRNGENRNGIDPGGALPNFYGCLYGGICSWNGQPSQHVVTGNGNHFVYADRPTATITIGNQTRGEGSPNGPFRFDISGLLDGDKPGSAIVAGPLGSSATTASQAGAYSIDGTFSSPVGYNIVVVPGTVTVTPGELQGAVFNRTGLQPLFTAQEQTFVYESNLGGVNICVGTNEPILALQQAEGEADTLAAEWKHVRSRPNLNNCLVVNGQHGCGEF
ncbi:filamentous hemagglutinin-like protein [Caballeronia temeraria]|uniref:Filamentous hemagglutinin-like protein n=1 Tax=Caballeronia temeraria TaxID=1777137 RepID=A0A158C6X8_9BURK|nr:filamentous hemagglutinin N-terminal domain-containing protein [Caballeronia temeraria]SAK78094.1 filamentous hemagglutinin-like protein [Caballeronia temeraria]